MGDLTENFDRSEFACQCGCGYDTIDLLLVNVLQQIRWSLGVPIRVMSGCRCQKHNEDVGGVPHSAHTRGLAVDMSCLDSEARMRLVGICLELGIVRIGIARTFIHVDIDSSLPAPRMWVY